MGFAEAVTSAFTRFIDFSTRSSRSEYWWFFLFYFVVNIVVNVADMMVIGSGIPQLIVLLVFLIPTLAVTVRRLHDVGRSGWWIFIALVPVVGFLIILYWMVIGGEDSENRFGANPLGAAA